MIAGLLDVVMEPLVRDSQHVLCSLEQINGFCDRGKDLKSVINVEISQHKALASATISASPCRDA